MHPGKVDKLILFASNCGGREAIPAFSTTFHAAHARYEFALLLYVAELCGKPVHYY